MTSFACATDLIPASPQTRAIIITGATIHPVNAPPIENGEVEFTNGKLTYVGGARKFIQAPDADIIEAHGKHVYPGLIDASTTIGLVEIDAVRATRDTDETGSINPNAKAIVAINPDSEISPTVRANGVLIANVVPQGGLISGTSGVVQLDGWTWEEMTLNPASAIIVRWPNMIARRDFDNPAAEAQQIEGRDRQLKQIEDAFDRARQYQLAKKSAEANGSEINFDARDEAMLPLIEGKIPMIVAASEQSQIESAVNFATRMNVRVIIYGASDARYCTELLKSRNVSVILEGSSNLPRNRDDAYDANFTLPSELRKAGVNFSIASTGAGWNSRNLPFEAGMACAHGLTPTDALASITLWPAQQLGISDRVGSIENGKDATLIITNGDLFEVPTQVEIAFIQGRKIDLSNRHLKLFEKYRKRIESK